MYAITGFAPIAQSLAGLVSSSARRVALVNCQITSGCVSFVILVTLLPFYFFPFSSFALVYRVAWLALSGALAHWIGLKFGWVGMWGTSRGYQDKKKGFGGSVLVSMTGGRFTVFILSFPLSLSPPISLIPFL